MTDKRLNNLIEFYQDLEIYVDKYQDVHPDAKDIALLRLAVEGMTEKMGLVKTSYIISNTLKKTLGISLGKDEDFKGLFSDHMDEKKTMH